MLYVMNFVLPFVNVILDWYLDLGHHQIQLITYRFIANGLLLDARYKFSEVLILRTDIDFVLDELYPLLYG